MSFNGMIQHSELQQRKMASTAQTQGSILRCSFANIFSVHIYFMLSPFCDPSSNNSALELQARSNPDMLALMYDRSAFEARLRSMGGLEYIIVEGPRSTTPEMNPVWVIRKQDREKSGAAGMPDSITVLGTYFCVAGNIYQAPGLKDMLSARVVCGLTWYMEGQRH